MAVHTYDPAQILVVFNGVPVLNGFAPDTFLHVERNEDTWTLSVGAAGEAVRAKSNNRSGKVTLTVMQSSLVNDLLSALVVIDENSPGGDGIGPLLIKDLQGLTLVSAETCWIVRPPNFDYAKDATTREWMLESDRLNIFVGGLIT